ncbi:MAG: hypothetical protein B5766_11835 [Candidatus Lumbricidophila eiseniae]|uniref:Lipoprotein n=1 Tax=Candidatus Lumbricidiphila eiseniae TaxID=1969409 RepID=A0A2A6FNT0_9MICO|nr:MAG: hypothetical protein B5766_11835 [Candidatus Lumbricidophila eiseniae]
MRHSARVVGLALVVLSSLVSLSGCATLSMLAASRGSAEGGQGDSAESGKNDVPTFTGPWAEEFSYSYDEATTDFERKALSDEKISEAEFAETEHRLKACLGAHGITFSGFTSDESFEFNFSSDMGSDRADELADKCSVSSGLDTVGSLFFQVRKNPQNLDWATIMAACLVKKKAVPPEYSASDYLRDEQKNDLPPTRPTGNTALDDCSADPLGLLTPSK